MPDQRTIIRYNLPRSQVDAIGDLARRHRTRHSARLRKPCSPPPWRASKPAPMW